MKKKKKSQSGTKPRRPKMKDVQNEQLDKEKRSNRQPRIKLDNLVNTQYTANANNHNLEMANRQAEALNINTRKNKEIGKTYSIPCKPTTTTTNARPSM